MKDTTSKAEKRLHEQIDDAFKRLAKDLKAYIVSAKDKRQTLSVLKSLYFKQLTDRHSEVREAHRNTFEWIFTPDTAINLATWLKSREGIYWIEGKPGSGKSTLMKFLLSDSRTYKALQQWSHPKGLLVAHHFFWSPGTSLQKSQTGLFRALLFQIFAHYPEIIPRVCSYRWSEDVLSWMGSWDRRELFETFKEIAGLQQMATKICFFIDGLDEYEGDHEELVEILRAIADSRHIKIVASSRPHYEFKDAFGKQPWALHLQDLTASDILLYVRDNLEQDSRFQNLKIQDTFTANTFVQEILLKSEGVFLWVFLVVRSLLRGLRNEDRISDLRRRLHELPGELEKYFELMLDSIDSIYQQTTARIFRVLGAAHSALPMVAFHFLDQEEIDPSYVFRANLRGIQSGEMPSFCNTKRRQLHANCRDLLWVARYQDKREAITWGFRVGFLHRTVADFLRTKHMSSVLTARSGDHFEPTKSLCYIHLAMVKCQALDLPDVVSQIFGTLLYAHEYLDRTGITELRALGDLEVLTERHSVDWKVASGLETCDSWVGLLIRSGFQDYLESQKSRINDRPDDNWYHARLLRHALRRKITIDSSNVTKWHDFSVRREEAPEIPMVRFFLELPASPNALLCSGEHRMTRSIWHWPKVIVCTGEHQTVWQDFLLQLKRVVPREPENVERNTWFEACELMISRDAQEQMEIVPAYNYRYLSATRLILEVFPDKAPTLTTLYPTKRAPQSSSGWSSILGNIFT